MAQEAYSEIGKLMVRIERSEKELDRVRSCGHIIAKQLRVLADCLDQDCTDVEILDMHRPHVFSSNHPDTEAKSTDMAFTEGPGNH